MRPSSTEHATLIASLPRLKVAWRRGLFFVRHSFQMKSRRRVRKLTGNVAARHCVQSRPGDTTSTRPIVTQCLEQAHENLPTDHSLRGPVDYSVTGKNPLSRESWRSAGSDPDRRGKRPLNRCDQPDGGPSWPASMNPRLELRPKFSDRTNVRHSNLRGK
jgi:hypothetical protein